MSEHFLTISIVVVSVLLMAAILLQQRGASLGGAFGAGSSVYRSRRGAEKIFFRFTIVLAILFIVLALLLLTN